ncbi:hypothetical protein S7711_08332 [Stachybotrys chartarum IBT 7711]|uniref:Peptidase A1 domain-containing protein n=1 Tax=Stachybotrys chartarum (strain CBS 109288 / IBT 7711) TaxID=1280523 RepID=A0A084AS64_STACB|nr:hypothetical protein S7711_08332 [Stachybotrys chartarum IBT 7711]
MRSFVFAALLAALVDETVGSSNLFPRARRGNGFLAVPVGTVDKGRSRRVRRQEGESIVTTLENMDFFYATEGERAVSTMVGFGLGSPPQSVTVLVDTGSSELWVNPDCSSAPSTSQARQCQAFGEYDPDDSNTPPIGPFSGEEINYGDPSDPSTLTSVQIRYYADDIEMGDATIMNQTFGVVVSSEGQSSGIMGLAPDLFYGFDGASNYSLLLNTMAEQDVIASRLFALDLRHAEAETGAIIYGGVDRNKFTGTLESRPIVRGQQGEYRLAVDMNTLGLTIGRSESFELQGDDTNVMLDSGTTLSRMHASAALPILEALGAIDDGEGYYVVPCTLREQGGSVDFGFGSKIVRVPFSDFILDVGDPNYCYAGVTVTTEQQILGDTVLRAGYFVFDWDSEVIHIAQAANCGDQDIVTFSSDDDEVTGNCDESDAFDTTATGEPTVSRTQTFATEAYTTTYTITSCPSFERGCETGLVTTQTIEAVTTEPTAEPTETSSGGGDGDEGGDGDSAGAHMEVGRLLAAGFGGLAAIYNVL